MQSVKIRLSNLHHCKNCNNCIKLRHQFLLFGIHFLRYCKFEDPILTRIYYHTSTVIFATYSFFLIKKNVT